MKNQFMPLNTSQGRQNHLEQMPLSDEWLTAGRRASTLGMPTTAQPQEGFPPQVTQRPAGKGLLSGWKSNQSQHTPDARYSVATSVVDQETLKQPAIQRPIAPDTFTQGFSTEVVSQRQSAMSQQPIMSTQTHTPPNLQVMPPPMQPMTPATPMQTANPVTPMSMPGFYDAQAFQPYTVQTASPTTGTLTPPPQSQTQTPFGTRPSQPLAPSQEQWQTIGRGGPPPFVQGPPTQGQGSNDKKGRKKKRRFPIWARVAVAVLLVLVLLSGTGIYYYETNFAAPVSNIIGQQAPFIKGEDNPNLTRGNTDILSGGRINILLLGSDDDQKFQGGYLLAQTDIVVTIDPASRSVGMLSIPRDLYVNVPGYGKLKLDEAYAYGARDLHNGVALSRLTISQDFGIPINYYAWVGLSGFIKVVSTAGGVDVDVTHPITDDVYPDDTGNSQNAYAYKRLYLGEGPQHLDGPTALEYVRSRHADLVGDFGRSARQQQVLSQLKTKLTSSPDIISKLPELAKDLNGYLKTDMQILDVVKLMNFARTIDPGKIQKVILSPPTFSSSGVAPNGESIFNPICAPIQQAIAKMFALGNNAQCNTGASNNKQPVLTSTNQATQPSAPVIPSPTNNSLQTLGQMASMSLNGETGSNSFGISSLLDLLFMVVFESFSGAQL